MQLRFNLKCRHIPEFLGGNKGNLEHIWSVHFLAQIWTRF